MKGVASSLTSQLVNQGRISPLGEGEFQRLSSALLNFLCCVTLLVGRWEGHPTAKKSYSNYPLFKHQSAVTPEKQASLIETEATLCPKKVTTLSRYNSDIHESILIIFGTNVLEKYAIKRYFIFSPQPTSASALPGEMKKNKNSILSLNAVLLHCHTSTSRWLNLFSLVTYNSCSCCYMTLHIS